MEREKEETELKVTGKGVSRCSGDRRTNIQ